MIFEKWSRKRQRLSGGQRGQNQHIPSQRELRLKYGALGIAFLVLVIAATRRIVPDTDTTHYDLDTPVAPATFTADIEFQSEDLEATQEAKEAAAAKVPEIYRVNEAAVKKSLESFDSIVKDIQFQKLGVEEAVRKAVKASGREKAETAAAKAVKTYAEAFAKDSKEFGGLSNPDSLIVWLTPSLEWVHAIAHNARGTESVAGAEAPAFDFAYADLLTQITQDGLERVLRAGVLTRVDTNGNSSKDPDRSIRIIRVKTDSDMPAEQEMQLKLALSADTVLNALRDRISDAAQKKIAANGSTQIDRIALQDAALEVAQLCLANTLQFDVDETHMQRETARLAVEPVMKTIYKDERIQSQGGRWSPQSLQDVRTYLAEKARYDKQTANLAGALVGHMILIGLILLAIERALPLLASRRPTPGLRELNLVLLLLCATAILGRVIAYFDDTGYLVPVAAAAILLAILTNARIAGFSGLLGALLLSIQFDYSWRLVVVSTAMSLTGVMSIFMVRRRSDMGSAAVKATLAGVLVMVGFSLAHDSLFSEAAFRGLVLIALNGLVCLFLVPGLLSPLEKLFGITTDIQLLEYSDLNNHILSRMAMEVPATYSHSLMLGQLAEAAADAIGANGLLARVSAYYHDIGKLRRPEYFVENQTGANIHDGLSPRLSARAIASHVTEGAEMARQLRLPKPLVDAIFEHHGTCLISFFYQEAVAQQKHGGVIEADFRYPGPRPQSRETAILMICDAVESAVRTLKNPNEERVRELVDRIITNRATDRQFDECDLTLRDLDTIAEVVTKRIASTQHKRIQYPDQTPKQQAPNVIAMSGGQDK